MSPVLQLNKVTVRYDNRAVVDSVDLSIEEGDILGIVGPNGAGKTTLFEAILGLQKYQGNINMFGYGPGKYETLIPLIGYVPQKIHFEPHFPASVYDVVSMGIISSRKVARGQAMVEKTGYKWNQTYGKLKTEDKVAECLKMTRIENIRDRRIGELSGGELQRVFIAKSLVKDPLLMILDEPVNSVDYEAQRRFYSVIMDINKENKITMVWSSHDLAAIESYASKVACMNGKMYFHGTKKQFFADECILKSYTEARMQMHMHRHD